MPTYTVQWVTGIAHGLATNLATVLNGQAMVGYKVVGTFPHSTGTGLEGFIVVFEKMA